MHGKVPMVEGRCTQNFRFQLLVFFTLYATLAFCNTQLLVFPRYQWRAKRLSKHHLQANQNTSFVWEKSFSVLKQLKKDSTMFWSNFFQKDSTMFWSNLKKAMFYFIRLKPAYFLLWNIFVWRKSENTRYQQRCEKAKNVEITLMT